jgi:hypothetical protein
MRAVKEVEAVNVLFEADAWCRPVQEIPLMEWQLELSGKYCCASASCALGDCGISMGL